MWCLLGLRGRSRRRRTLLAGVLIAIEPVFEAGGRAHAIDERLAVVLLEGTESAAAA